MSNLPYRGGLGVGFGLGAGSGRRGRRVLLGPRRRPAAPIWTQHWIASTNQHPTSMGTD